MLQISSTAKIYFAKEHVDFRCGIEKLSGYCRNKIAIDPMCGAYFVFRNRLGKQLKVLHYDGIGYYLCLRRFSKGKIGWWPERPHNEMDVYELQVLLFGGNPEMALFPSFWKKVK